MASFDDLFPQLTTFPIRAIRSDGGCTCLLGADCQSIGKHPACYYRKLEARHKCTGVDGCPACFTYPVAADGWGIATGAISGIFVVDLDGDEAFDNIAPLGPLPPTLAVRRPPDHVHLYYQHPGFTVKNSAGELAPHVDIRGDTGLVVAPWSPHKSGATYEIAADLPVAPAPAWLLAWPGLRRKKLKIFESTSDELKAREKAITIPRAWRIKRAKAWLSLQPPAISGENGHKRTMRTVSIAVRQNWLTDASMVREAVEGWNKRCQPPWEDRELDHKIDEALHRSTLDWSLTLREAYRETRIK